MAKRRASLTPDAPHDDPTVAPLRIDHRGPEDIVGSGEGFLLLYDPAIVTPKLLGRFRGLEPVARSVLGWVAGNQGGAIVAEPGCWASMYGRREGAKRVAELVELSLLRAITLLPIEFRGYGADFRFQSRGLTAGEIKAHHRLRKSGQVPAGEPVFAWIAATTPRLVATSSLFMRFTAARKRKEFGPGYEVEFAWPIGDYRVWGWSFDDGVENEDGQIIDLKVVRLERWPPKGWPAEPLYD
jgi:hypothetical protein